VFSHLGVWPLDSSASWVLATSKVLSVLRIRKYSSVYYEYVIFLLHWVNDVLINDSFKIVKPKLINRVSVRTPGVYMLVLYLIGIASHTLKASILAHMK